MRRSESGRLRGSRVLVALAGIAVLVSAADTYVVVLALPDIMLAVGLDAADLQRAAPIVSLFLLGYVVALPVLGRLSDLYGRRRILLLSLLLLAVGSMVTALATSLPAVVTGRLIQGAGGGGLVPATLALIADGWSVHRRGVPLGVLGGVQELGSLVGPLVGAAILAVADWRAIFWLTLIVALVLAAGMLPLSETAGGSRSARPREGPQRSPRPARRGPGGAAVGAQLPGALLLAAGLLLALMFSLRPAPLVRHLTVGGAFVPVLGGWRATEPVALAAVTLLVAFVVSQLRREHPLIDVRALPSMARETDLVGATLLAVALGSVVLVFGAADAQVSPISQDAPWQLGIGAVAGVAAGWRARRTSHPLVPRGSLSSRQAQGALVVSFLVGAALIAAVVEVPVYVRTVLPGTTQLDAAYELLHLLAAIPVGALLGGWLSGRVKVPLIAGAGMALVTACLLVMAGWDATATEGWGDDLVLAGAGLGFGLVIAPVNAALLAAVPAHAHGVLSAFLVLARMVGMLIGLSLLTAIGLHRFTSSIRSLEGPEVLCPTSPLSCPPYVAGLREAALAQVQATLLGAAVCAALASVAALVLLRPHYAAPSAEHESSGGPA